MKPNLARIAALLFFCLPLLAGMFFCEGCKSSSGARSEIEANSIIDSMVDIGDRQLDSLDTLYITRLRSLNTTIPLPYNDRVKHYINEYMSLPASTSKLFLRRYEKYMPVIEIVLAKYGLPEELKALALIESHLNPQAVSPFSGATGLWQFTKESARAYGLVVNDEVDERTDPVKSTIAAAKHLKHNYNELGEDWLLTIAAFNCGVNGVRKAVVKASGRKVGKADVIADTTAIRLYPGFWPVYKKFCRETRNYIPSVVAVIYAANFYEQ